MPQPPKLTEVQKRRLAVLEPSLKNAVRAADYQTATKLASEIQEVLRPTGHEHRLCRAKTWLYEAGLEAGKTQIAISGLVGVRRKVRRSTRLYLEATALLSIAHLRRNAIAAAKPLVRETLQLAEKNIASPRRRRQFRKRLIARFEEEAALAAVRGIGNDLLDPEEIQEAAGQLLLTSTDDDLLKAIGAALPEKAVAGLLEVSSVARGELPQSELNLLPPGEDLKEKRNLGRRIFEPVKRVLWRSLCDPKSDVYKAWYGQGFGVVLDKKVIGAAIVAAFANLGVGLKALAVPALAIVIKVGVEIFCEVSKPKTLMIGLEERD